ncbi:AAA family ATPase [Archangium sp.]|uniref:AAA family ATPase n=1 Tax=Archangium sp. TaxID=1872627 RepID=UPI002D39452C|nr:AAA family ATPase [Archangium sp.]HYO52756.1 AAA family ATPase [Archangium sp.]
MAHQGLTLYARVDGSFSVWDPIRNNVTWQYGMHSPLDEYEFSQQELWDGLERNNRVVCNGLIRDWVSWQLKRSESFERLRRVLKVLSPDEQEPLSPGEPTRVSIDDVRDIPTLEMPYGTVPLTHASAAVKRIVGLAYLLVWSWEEHQRAAELLREKTSNSLVLLVDEVEAHLHPRWQRLILPSLLAVVRALRPDVKVQLLAVTHAPMLLASIEPHFDPEQDALFMFDLVGGEVKVTRADWRPRGDANAWLTSEVFDLKEPRSVEAEQVITRAKAALKDPNLPLEKVREIHNELYRLLKDTDPFWPSWLARAEAAGIEPEFLVVAGQPCGGQSFPPHP